jgi:hypothetical protein
MRPIAILDKSFLRGGTPAELRSLCSKYCVLAPSALFYELFTCSKSIRSTCFSKFPPGLNPVELIQNVGNLLRYEARKHRPARPLFAHRAEILFEFNPGLGAGLFQFTSQHQRAIQRWRENIEVEADIHEEICKQTIAYFPEVIGASGRTNKAKIEELRQRVMNEPKVVRLLYNKFRKRSYPSKDIIGQSWALFVWTQVHLLAVLRKWKLNGVHAPYPDRTTLEHDVVDMQFQIMGILAGRIATRDKNIRNVVCGVAPRTEIIGYAPCA